MLSYLLHQSGIRPKYYLKLEDASPSNNIIKGLHFHAYRTCRKKWALKVFSALGGIKPSKPINRSGLVVIRHSSGHLDWDNAYGGLKPILDSLVSPSSRNPDGLGLIEDDNPTNMPENPLIFQMKSKKGEGETEIFIYDLDDPEASYIVLKRDALLNQIKSEFNQLTTNL